MFMDDPSAQLPLDPEEIEIQTRAYGVNFKDVFIAMGQMLPGVKMAGECAGVITRIGFAVQQERRLNVGDRVCAAGPTPFCSKARAKGNNTFKLPDSMSFSVGASIPIVFLTAYYCLVEVARILKGHTVLIHAAAGGVGQAAIMIAQNLGTEIFATVGSTAKKELLIEKYYIPESHVFSSRTTSFKQ
jgi:NADPH:quinone reductase-like Zn-dependent oxidoreductase